MKIVVIGDIHGRTVWRDILEKETDADRIVFLGDYVSSHDGISAQDQIENLKCIMDLAEKDDRIVLLRGNHDMQHLGYSWAECSGFFWEVCNWMSASSVKERFLRLTRWVYIYENYILSHAGISRTWLESTGVPISKINDLEPSELFGFIPDSPYDYYGESVTQPLTWIRPESLSKDMVPGYDQVVGHTYSPLEIMQRKNSNKVILCDKLPNKYLVINDNTYKFETL